MVTGIREGDGRGGNIRKLQKQDARNAPRVQKNVEILQQNVAAAAAATIVVLVKSASRLRRLL
jgi:hypothetical protein